MGEFDYQSNSDKSREKNDIRPEKRVNKAITNKVRTRKSNKLFDTPTADEISNLKDYIVKEVAIPYIKKAIDDIVVNGIRMILYPGSEPRKSSGPAERVSYRNYNDPRVIRSDDREESRTRNRLEYDDLIFENRGEAERVLDTMEDIVDRYGVVSIGDLYELVEISTDNCQVHKYGWKENIRSAQIIRVRDGYMLKMPRARALN